MKKILLIAVMLLSCVVYASAQNEAKIKFEKVTYNFGKFSVNNPVQEASFNFINEGKSPLVINQVVTSCGCTVATYTKKPIAPGKSGVIKVKYNGKGRFPSHIKKMITVRTNGVPEMVRLYIEGEMVDDNKK
ncbi:MAG: DUF1573 domain-containing protein [Prevotella sp.]|jgi:hypothetical protein